MKRPLEKAETDVLMTIKGDIIAAKKRLRSAVRDLSKLADDYNAESNAEAEAAAMHMRGGALLALGHLDQAHSKAMAALCDCFDDGDIVIQGGGGGR